MSEDPDEAYDALRERQAIDKEEIWTDGYNNGYQQGVKDGQVAFLASWKDLPLEQKIKTLEGFEKVKKEK